MKLPNLNLRFPFNIPLLLWDAATFMTSSSVEALRFYHEMVAEILELVQP